ncbi:Tox-REase-5 domain-containing protein [Archangium violaceum]|uniref:Tox-REase-5 domain-containing protein n=1 Tax=Archangium violaceum TaxID=83451 RepID=UPI00126A568C|nr:Tox-REase-5 domain-containing protein [Archangium violaceum]
MCLSPLPSSPAGRGLAHCVPLTLALLMLGGCAMGTPLPGLLTSPRAHRLTPALSTPARPPGPVDDSVRTAVPPGDAPGLDEDDDPEDDVDEQAPGAPALTADIPGDESGSRGRRPVRGEDEQLEDESLVGWRDGVGEGRPWPVPFSVDHFQGLLVQVGVSPEVLPGDGGTLSPQQAAQLLAHLLEAEAGLGEFPRQRMAAHLLLEVATAAEPVTREELHARMDRYEVGPFYAAEDGQLWPVDTGLEVPRGAMPLGPYVPDDGVVLPALEGAGLALGDTLEGLAHLVFHPGESLEGLTRLPGAVRVLLQNAPEYWEAFRHKPRGERVREGSRLLANVLLTVGTSGAGAVKAVGWGEKLGRLSVPLLTLTKRGELVLRLVAVPGRAVTVAGQGLSVAWGLHLAKVGSGGGSGWVPPVGGPGQWVPKNERMSPRSRAFQHKVSKAPAGWVYRVWRNGEKADFDGFELEQRLLQETKGLGYDKHFDANLEPKEYFKGAARLVKQAQRQWRVANGIAIRWHVAEPRMVPILQKLFKANKITGIEVVFTPPP